MRAFSSRRGVAILAALLSLAALAEAGGQGAAEAPDLVVDPGGGAARRVELSYFYSPDCRSCVAFLEETLPAIARREGTVVTVKRRDIMERSGFEALGEALTARGLSMRALPVLMSSGSALQGEKEIHEGLSALVAGGEAAPRPGPDRPADLSPLPVLAAALVDGINPCAFSTIIFLLSSLALAGRSRRDILLIGACFTAAVFATYTAIGFGALALLRAASLLPLLARILRYAMAGVLVVFAVLGLVDLARSRRGGAQKPFLSLPGAMRGRIHEVIRTHRRSGPAFAASVVLGVLVATFELGCTGQIYLPTLVYMAGTEGRTSGYLLLVAYNLVFVLPLVLVFAAAYLGLRAPALARFFKDHLGATRLLVVLVFVLLALLLVLT